MYILPSIVDAALPEGIDWPTPMHKNIAQSILIKNPSIRTYEDLHRGVCNILNIPKDKIENINLDDLKNYGFYISTIISV